MTEIEVTAMSAQQTGSGEIFNLIPIPFELSRDQCRYRNPSYNIDVRFEARFIRDEMLIENVRRVMWSGVILIDSQLQQRLEKAVGQRLSKAEIETLVDRCYDLIVEFLRANYARFVAAELRPHIYAASPRVFDTFSLSAEVDRSAVEAPRAALIR
jgi:hypothetical protein